MKQAIARTCVALGFKNAQASVLDSLADVMRHYNQQLSSQTLAIAELHGRVQPGIQDQMAALQSMVCVSCKYKELYFMYNHFIFILFFSVQIEQN